MPTSLSAIEQRLDMIREIITAKDFLGNKGIANEVGIYIFCYEAKDEPKVSGHIKRLCKEEALHIILYDLYDLFISTLEEVRVIDKAAAIEQKEGSSHLHGLLLQAVPPRKIVERMKATPHARGRDVVFITGVDAAYPFIRAHDVLNNMHSSFEDVPVVMFYPGSYDGQSLSLFGRYNEGSYYRAFNLLDWRLHR